MLARFGGFTALMVVLLAGAACLSVGGQDDTLPPTVRFLSPENNAIVSGEVVINIEATDDTGIILVRLFRNNILVGQTQAAPYSFTWDSGGFTDGEYSLAAEAVDLVQNRAVAEITVTVANTGKAGIPPAN